MADNAVWEAGLLSRDKHVMPWRIEDELKCIGANYVQAGMWRGFARYVLKVAAAGFGAPLVHPRGSRRPHNLHSL